MNKNAKKDYAKLLFTQENLTQKEIAEKVGVSEQTLTKWVNADNEEWKRLRQNIIVTKKEQLSRIYEQIDEINSSIRSKETGRRYADSKEADTLVKLTAAAKNLESEASVGDAIEIGKKFLSWLKPLAPAKAREIAVMFDDFIRDLLKR
jgi:transcriptional regulator with XRE-family HTH domain